MVRWRDGLFEGSWIVPRDDHRADGPSVGAYSPLSHGEDVPIQSVTSAGLGPDLSVACPMIQTVLRSITPTSHSTPDHASFHVPPLCFVSQRSSKD